MEWTFERIQLAAAVTCAGIAAMLPDALHFYYPVLRCD
jgi:hypothetical protein